MLKNPTKLPLIALFTLLVNFLPVCPWLCALVSCLIYADEVSEPMSARKGRLPWWSSGASAGDMGSIPGPGRSHMPQGN